MHVPGPSWKRVRAAARAAAAAVLLASVLLPARPASASDARLVAYGKHLSAECSACHRTDGADTGIPSITGWRIEDFIVTMGFYKSGERPNPVMVSVAKSLDEEQIKALAAYYGSLPPAPRGAASKSETKSR